jgi:type II secretory ATPase GspE/PulE/Tfp pilus assembly ATPase PilB-like protein
VIAQRLVRVLCPDCKKAVAVDGPANGGAAAGGSDLRAKIQKFLARLPAQVDKKPYEQIALYSAVGCDKCSGIGYKGRIGIFEFLQGTPDLEQTILKEASEVALRGVAKKQGMVTMQEDGVLKALLGQTTFEEVKSVTGEIEW